MSGKNPGIITYKGYSRGAGKYYEVNENKTPPQNLQYAAKAVLRGKFTASNSYLLKRRISKQYFTLPS